MADTADKSKEKKKKKATGSTKEKEKKTTGKSTETKDKKPDEQPEQSSTAPQSTQEQPAIDKTEVADQSKSKQTPKDSQKDSEKIISKVNGPQDAQKSSKPAPEELQTETAAPVKINEPEIVPSDISEKPLIKPEYTAPPPATKKDVDLLKDLDEAKLEELREAFVLFDLDKDGIINFEDLRLTFATLGQPNIPDNELKQMLSETIGPLDFESFVILLGYKTIELDPEAILIDALSRWDYDNSGLISEERIKHDLVTWGDKFTPEEADLALDDAPVCMKKGTAMIDYIKFCNTLSGLRKKTKMPVPEDFMSKAH